MIEVRISNHVFKPALIPSLVCLFFFCLTISLGKWQWERSIFKQGLKQRFQEGAQSEPLTLEMANRLGKDVHAYPVTVRGVVDNSHNLILDNRVWERQAGFHVLTLLRLEDGSAVYVNRGWMPWGRDRTEVPVVDELGPSVIEVRGRLYFPSDKQFVLKEDDYRQVKWPLLVQKLDLASIEEILGVELQPFIIRVDPNQKLEAGDQFPRDWQFLVMSAEKSRGYSFQWFGLAFVLLVLYLVFSTRRLSEIETSTGNLTKNE